MVTGAAHAEIQGAGPVSGDGAGLPSIKLLRQDPLPPSQTRPPGHSDGLQVNVHSAATCGASPCAGGRSVDSMLGTLEASVKHAAS